jgi:hypothetical protein
MLPQQAVKSCCCGRCRPGDHEAVQNGHRLYGRRLLSKVQSNRAWKCTILRTCGDYSDRESVKSLPIGFAVKTISTSRGKAMRRLVYDTFTRFFNGSTMRLEWQDTARQITG